MTRRLLSALAVVGIVLVSCSHPSGHVRIGMVYSGGPFPGLSHSWRPGVVRVYRADGSFVTSRHLAEGQTLDADLAPGTYRAIGHSGDAGCQPRKLTVQGGQTVVVRIVCVVF